MAEEEKAVATEDRQALARRWSADLEMSKNSDKDFITAGKKIVKRYRDQRTQSDDARKYNILWSNVQTLNPAVYAKKPKAQVQRRFKDADPVGRCASQILERALQFEIDHYSDYDSTLRNVVLDRLLPGRGVAWVRFEPTDKEEPGAETEVQVTDDQGSKSMGSYECAPCDYVYWEDFRTSPARTWEEVTWAARLVYMGKDEIVKRFGDECKDVPLSHEPIGIDQMKEQGTAADQIERMKKAKVWEIWCKTERKVYWHCEGYSKILDIRDDPLKLEGFFPCPKPVFATLTTDTLCPVPDFKQYQDQAKEMDELTGRIALLVKAVKVVGVYDASCTGIQRMLSEGGDNVLIPVDSWAAFAEKGGIKGTVDWLPLDMVLQALGALYEARDAAKQAIYEITGLSDIIRGSSVASETATAQQIKSQFASLRIKALTSDVARFASDLLRMKAQIMCSMYRPEILVAMSSMDTSSDAEHIPAAIQLLQNDVLRAFRIEVATDSLVELDEAGEKQSRMEFLTAAGSFLRDALPMVQQVPEMGELAGELLMFGVRSFKTAAPIEAAFEGALQKITNKQPAEQQPDPVKVKAEADAQTAQAKIQAQQQTDQAKLQSDQQAEAMRTDAEQQRHAMSLQAAAQMEQMRQAFEVQREERAAERQAQADQVQAMFDQFKALLDAQTKIDVAQISANATMTTAQDAASDAAVS